MNDEIVVFTDGACSGNPGPGGWGAIIYYGNSQIQELGGAQDPTTNNQMELQSVLASLEYLKDVKTSISFYVDSTYVINGVTKWMWGWHKKNWLNSENKPISNKEVWQKIYQIMLKNKLFHIQQRRISPKSHSKTQINIFAADRN